METEIEKTMDETLGNFVTVTAKTRVAVIIPMYGYWSDIPDNPLIKEKVFDFVMSRIWNPKGLPISEHYLYYIFVANPQTIPTDPKDRKSVANFMLKMAQGGNVKSVPVDREASYPEYIEAGMDCALNETNAQFVVIFNPWVMIQENAIDIIVDRANRSDQAKVISGFDFRSITEPENFDRAKINIPTEEWDVSFNFMAMPRWLAEMITIDANYLTHDFLERDIWQAVFSKGFGVITSQRIPIFPFDFPWDKYETKEQHEQDKAYFGKKWGFIPDLPQDK